MTPAFPSKVAGADNVRDSPGFSATCRPQDFQISLKVIHDYFVQRKMTAQTAMKEIIASRAVGARKFIEAIEYIVEEEERAVVKRQSLMAQMRLEQTQKRFHDHPAISEFMSQFLDPDSVKHRYKVLLLRGESRAGKTAKGKSLYGSANTLTVNCQGCSPSLPSIAAFDRRLYSAILWDEITEQQVLQNKVVFQAGAEMITLGQSKTNIYAYSRFLHGVAMILCSNTFVMPRPDQEVQLSAEDADWLTKNIIEVELPPGAVWYAETSSDED